MDVACLQRRRQEVFIFPCWWEHVWQTAFDLTDGTDLAVFVPDSVAWHQRICGSGSFEIAVSHIHI